MKPRLLKISGLNSFIEEQTIDFEALTEYGLFGIFGATGSGKSTILDAIILALYGEIPRCDKKNMNGIINTNSKQVYVYYEFDIGAGKNRKAYSIERILKRTRDDGVTTDIALLCDITNPMEKQVLSEKVTTTNQMVEEIIGLNAQDFMRSVVLPQGSFSEFLQLKGNERRQMLERIFCLEEYGEKLTEKVRMYQQKVTGMLKEMDGQLNTYETISEDALKELESVRDNITELKQSLQKSWEETEKDYEKYKDVWATQEELKAVVDELEALRKQQQDIDSKIILLDRARKAESLKPGIDRLERLELDLNERRRIQANLMEELNRVEQEIEKLEVSWKQAREDKDMKLPLLAVKKENLIQAVEMLKEAVSQEEKADELLKEYNKKVAESKKTGDDILKKTQEIDFVHKKIEENRQEQGKHIISSNEKQAIEEAYSLERDYKALVQKCSDLHRKKDSLCVQIQQQKDQLIGLAKIKEEVERRLYDAIQLKAQHEKCCPGTQEVLLERQKELSNKLEHIRRISEIESQISRRKEQLSQYTQSEAKLREVIDDLRAKYKAAEKDFAELNDKLKEKHNRNMAFILADMLEDGKACPVCGSTHHPMPMRGGIEAADIEELKDKVDELQRSLNDMRIEIARREAEHKQILDRMQEANNDLNQWREDLNGQDSSVLKQEYQEECKGFEQLKKDIEQWQKALEDIGKNIDDNKNQLSVLNSQEAARNASLEGLQNAFKEVEDEESQEKLKLERLEAEYQTAQNKWGIVSFEERIQEIRNHEKILESLSRTAEQLKSQAEGLNGELGKLRESQSRLEIEKVRLEESWKQIIKAAEDKQEQSKQLAKGDEPIAKLKEVSQEIETIQDRWTKLDKIYQDGKIQLEKLKNQWTAASEGCKSIEEQLMKESETLMGLMAEQGFADRDAVMEHFMEKKDMESLDKKIREHQERISILEDHRGRLLGKLQGRSIKKEDWEELQNRRVQLGQELEDCRARLVKVQMQCEDMARKLEEKKVLLKRKQELEHKHGLVEEIASLIRGKRFVDFVARRQLQHIAREASQRLKQITRQRYALELDGDGNFIIRDDFNGGARRPAHTLSGGETFITSLSLALALSSHIQLGKAVLEFFFLDEGFGTLDPELLDTVITSLEQLRNDRLSIGLISHVNELKQRIPKKLLVYPAVPGKHGTRVSLE